MGAVREGGGKISEGDEGNGERNAHEGKIEDTAEERMEAIEEQDGEEICCRYVYMFKESREAAVAFGS